MYEEIKANPDLEEKLVLQIIKMTFQKGNQGLISNLEIEEMLLLYELMLESLAYLEARDIVEQLEKLL